MSNSPPPSLKDANQVLKYAFDDASGKLRVDAVISPDGHDLEIDHVDDSIAIGTPTDLFTATTIGPQIGLDVNIINSIPIPAGAATSAKQDTGNASLASIDSKLTDTANGLKVDGSGITQPVSVTSLPLPSGASTSVLQTSGNNSLASIDTKLTSPLTVTGPLTNAQLRAAVVPVDGSGVTQPVSALSLPLPTGASTSALQTTGNTSLSSIDTKLTSPITITGALTNTQLRASAIAVDGSAVTQPVSAAALPLPSGAATSAKQDTGNISLASIDSKLTSPLIVTGPLTDIQLRATAVPISGTVTANAGTNLNTSLLALDSTVAKDATLNTLLKPASTLSALTTVGTITNVVHVDDNAGSLTVDQGGTWNLTNISGTISLPTGASTSALQTTGNASLSSIDTKLTSPLTVTGPLTNTQLRASAVPVDGSGVTQPISTASLPLPTGASTSALQTTGNTSLSSIDTKMPALGQTTMTGSRPVVIASNQSSIPVAATLSAETTKVIGTVNVSASQTIATTNAGTFAVQAAQSGTWTVQPGNTANITAWKVDGSAVTQPISGTVTANLATGSNAIGKLSANSGVIIGDVNVVNSNVSTNLAQVSGTIVSTSNGVVGAGVQRVAIASDNTAFSVNATPPTLTIGTQGSTGYSVQELKDAGRTALMYYATAVASGATGTETAITLTKASGTSATSTGVSQTPASGKRFRITNITFATRGNATATAQVTTFNMRVNTAGAVTTTSTPLVLSCRSATPATSSTWDRVNLELPEGYEILGNGTLQFGITANAVFTTNGPTWDVTVVGFEY